VELGNYLKNYQVKKPVSNITNSRQYWVQQFAQKLEAQKKKDNLYRFWLWRGKRIRPEFIRKEEWKQFQTYKLPIDKRYIKPWEDSLYAIKLGHVATSELAPFWDKCMSCDDSKGYNFTVCFFHSLKVEKKK